MTTRAERILRVLENSEMALTMSELKLLAHDKYRTFPKSVLKYVKQFKMRNLNFVHLNSTVYYLYPDQLYNFLKNYLSLIHPDLRHMEEKRIRELINNGNKGTKNN